MKEKFTWPTKIIALSFVGMVIVMNVWFHHYLFGGEVPVWANRMMEICGAGVLFGGFCQFGIWIRKRLSKQNEE